MMGLNMPNLQIARELDLNESDVQEMTSLLRGGIHKRRRPPRPEGETETDEVYAVAGHKGRPDRIIGRKGRRNRLKGARGRGDFREGKTAGFRHDSA